MPSRLASAKVFVFSFFFFLFNRITHPFGPLPKWGCCCLPLVLYGHNFGSTVKQTTCRQNHQLFGGWLDAICRAERLPSISTREGCAKAFPPPIQAYHYIIYVFKRLCPHMHTFAQRYRKYVAWGTSAQKARLNAFLCLFSSRHLTTKPHTSGTVHVCDPQALEHKQFEQSVIRNGKAWPSYCSTVRYRPDTGGHVATKMPLMSLIGDTPSD